jgi:hypothetical protein
MSIVFEVTLDDQPVQLEITRDGELIFLDYNITHDLAALEFGYPDTDATKLYAEWQRDPSSTLIRTLARDDVDNETMVSLAIEFAEHVLPIYKRWHPKKSGPRDLLDASRGFLLGQVPYAEFMSLRRRLRLGDGDSRRVIHRGEGAVRARMAAHLASTAVVAAHKSTWSVAEYTYGAAFHGQSAVAYDDCDQKNLSPTGEESGRGIGWTRFDPSPEFQWASQAERAWQIRRFVDCIEAIGQGLDWKATP